jgi:hypothetical protein
MNVPAGTSGAGDYAAAPRPGLVTPVTSACNSLLGLTGLQRGSGGGPGVAHATHPALPDMQQRRPPPS